GGWFGCSDEGAAARSTRWPGPRGGVPRRLGRGRAAAPLRRGGPLGDDGGPLPARGVLLGAPAPHRAPRAVGRAAISAAGARRRGVDRLVSAHGAVLVVAERLGGRGPAVALAQLQRGLGPRGHR